MPKFSPEHWRTIEAVFLAAGFRFVRQEGSHRSYVKPGVARPVVIPAYKVVPVFIIRNNLKTAGLSRDDYFRLLDQMKKTCPGQFPPCTSNHPAFASSY